MVNKKTIGFIVGIVLIIGAIIFLGATEEDPSRAAVQTGKSSAALTADRTMQDFGTINIFDGKVETTYELTNDGTEDVVITAATTSCGCTDGEIDGQQFGMHELLSENVTVSAGQAKTLTAIYDPLAHGPDATGAVTRDLILTTNSEQEEEVRVRLRANVVKE